jgi:putative tricarboxylic transport membrane protein
MHPRLWSIVPHTVMLCVAGVLYWIATGIDSRGAGAGRIGPDAWPKFIIAAIAALCVYEIVKRLLIGTTFTATGLAQGLNVPPEAADREIAGQQPPANNRRLLAGVVLIFAYAVGVGYAGFFVATAMFLALFCWIGGVRRPLVVALIGLAGAAAALVMFMRVAYVSLPVGVGPFKALSTALLRLIGA